MFFKITLISLSSLISISAINPGDIKKIKLSGTEQCIDGIEDIFSYALHLRDCSKSNKWKFFPQGEEINNTIQIEHNSITNKLLDATPADKENINILHWSPRPGVHGQEWQISEQNRISIIPIKPTDTIYCLSYIGEYSNDSTQQATLMTKICNQGETDPDENVKQIWEFTD